MKKGDEAEIRSWWIQGGELWREGGSELWGRRSRVGWGSRRSIVKSVFWKDRGTETHDLRFP